MGAKFFYRDIDLVYFVNNKLISNNLINQKDRVLLSFSGGQDSICLLFILNQLYSQLELDITFFWCHHLWQTDSFYLMQQIAKLSFLFQFNSCFAIPLNFISSELLARKWRQSCNYRVSLFYNYSKICLAHTFNDKVETIFLNFVRGTGLVGLSPLRWTQLISKHNITKEKHISQHNYLSSGASEPNKPNMCIPSMQENQVFAMANPDKLKNLTKEVIKKLINCSESDSSDPLTLYVYSSYPVAKRRVYETVPQTSLLVKLDSPYPEGVELCYYVNNKSVHPLPITDSAPAYPKGKQTYALLKAYPGRGKKVGPLVVKSKPQYLPSIHIASSAYPLPLWGIGKQAQHSFHPCTPLGYGVKGYTPRFTVSGCKRLALPRWQRDEMNVIPLRGKKLLLRKSVRALLPRFASKQLINSCYIARPLLFISRIELNKICYFWELPIYPDKSNQKVKFLRNRVRQQLLPTIKLFFNSNIENIFLQLAKIVETEDYCLTPIMNEFTQHYKKH